MFVAKAKLAPNAGMFPEPDDILSIGPFLTQTAHLRLGLLQERGER
jgi:hypothetical protein